MNGTGWLVRAPQSTRYRGGGSVDEDSGARGNDASAAFNGGASRPKGFAGRLFWLFGRQRSYPYRVNSAVSLAPLLHGPTWSGRRFQAISRRGEGVS
jgi:hypothetical protein